METALAWIATWAVASTLFLLLVFAGWSFRERRELRALGAKYPFRIICSKLVLLVRGKTPRGLGEKCVGRDVWLSWDLRWGPYGQTAATIVGSTAVDEIQIRTAAEVDILGYKTDRFLFRALRVTPSFGRGVGAADGVLSAIGYAVDAPASATIVLL